jgi:hypothetical protein
MSVQPSTIGPYRVVRVLGRGGMGIVYEGFDPAVNRRVALKVILDEALDATAMARFEREARLLARVKHPNVVAVHALERLGRSPVLITELIEGARPVTPGLAPREAAAVVSALADGVEAVHRAGVLHRDLKPANVVRRADGSIVLLDFGVARELDGSSLTRTGEVVGTPAFMAPEQVVGRDVDARADVYGLGAVLYALLVGSPPFEGSMVKVLSQVVEVEPRWPRERVGAPAGLDAIVRRAMAKAPAERFQTAGALRDELDRWLAAPEERGARRPAAAIVGLVVTAALMAAVGVGVAVMSGEPPAAPDAASPVAAVAPAVPVATTTEVAAPIDALEAHLAAARRGAPLEHLRQQPLVEVVLPLEARSSIGRSVRAEFLDARRLVAITIGGSRAATARVTAAALEWTALLDVEEVGALSGVAACGSAVALGGPRGLVLYDLATGRRRRLADTPVVDLVSARERLLFSDGQRLAFVDTQLEGARPVEVVDLGAFVSPGRTRDLELALSPDGAEGVVLAIEGNRVVDETRAFRLRLPGGAEPLVLPSGMSRKAVAVAPSGDLALGGETFQLEVWGPASGWRLVLDIAEPLGLPAISRVAFSPRGRAVYAATRTNKAHLKNEVVAWVPGQDGGVRRTERPHAATSLAVSPDGLLLAVGTGDGTLEVWVAGDDVE